MVRQQGLRVSTDGPEVLWTEGDKVNVRRITQNLLLNAIKYTAHGEVQLSWGEDKTSGRWWLMVSDTGPGLSPHLLAHLKRFSSLSEPARPTSVQSAAAVVPRQAITRGEGIGLRIVQELVDLLEARLEVSSQPNEGTQFKISFPLWYN